MTASAAVAPARRQSTADRRQITIQRLQRYALRADTEPAAPSRARGFFWSTVSGLTSTIAHAGGPPFAIYMLAQKMDKTLFVGTSAVFFLVVNYVKLVP